MDLVLIPTFARPEYLHLCLEHLRQADGGTEKHVWIAQDSHHRDSVDQKSRNAESRGVAEMARPYFADVRFIPRQPHGYVGNPYNFLELYREAYASNARFVYLVEDDVLVGRDFFTWHETVQAKSEYLCSVGWHCIRNPKAICSEDPEGYIESARDFSSIGVCWRRSNLFELVRHAHVGYYGDLSGYLHRVFPNSKIPHGVWTEQAGLIMRILLETEGAKVAWPVRSRCAHVGISGYHRAGGFNFRGDLPLRINALREAVQDTAKLVGLSHDPFDDVSALPAPAEWRELRVVQTFEEKTA